MVDIECPVCGFLGSERYISKTFENLESTWVKCAKCGTLFMSPLPTEKELNEYYRQSYKYRKSPGSVSHCFRYSEKSQQPPAKSWWHENRRTKPPTEREDV